jgi:KDO2-lipid IV(A) lauroyltransferase
LRPADLLPVKPPRKSIWTNPAVDGVVCVLGRALVLFVQGLPLRWAAGAGRFVGGLCYWLDSRHRRVALRNLAMCFPNLPEKEIRRLAQENFRRLGENYTCAVKTASMSMDELRPFCRFTGTERIVPAQPGQPSRSRVFAIGHFGNFELYARFGQLFPGHLCVATYRSLKQPSLTRLMQSLRNRSGCRFFERRREGADLRAVMAQPGTMLGLLADQHAGRHGVWQPFLGHVCSTSPAPALFALRYDCPLHVGICYRVALGQWEIEIGEEVCTREGDRRRTVEEITADVNRALERAVLRDPANWFWVHRRWKSLKPPRPRPQPSPEPPGTR